MNKSKTEQNLEQALAGESMAHIKYLYFAKLCREQGYSDIADHFEHTARQEIKHAWSHLELLLGKPSAKQCLEYAIACETYEYQEMYPAFEEDAEREGNEAMLLEARAQVLESRQHAQEFQEVLALAQRRFKALAAVEKHHAQKFSEKLERL